MVEILSLEKDKLPKETDMEYLNRLCSIKKDLNLTWKDIADLAEENIGYTYSDSWYRKKFNSGGFLPEYVTTCSTSRTDVEEDLDDETDFDNEELRIESKLRELQLKKAELCDIVASNNAMIRRLSREQTIKEIAHDFAETMSTSKQLIPLPCSENLTTGKEGILLISDWHYGLTCDNYWNTFNPEICKARVGSLLTQTIDAIESEKLQKLTVLDLSDLIAGRIHTQIRIESRFDVITQTMEVSEILAEFLSSLSAHCPIDFYSCLDNHSRVEPNKNESLDLESLTRIIPWYLKERLQDNVRIKIIGNTYDEDIITCEVLGHSIIAVHGHNDQPADAITKLSMLTHKHYDMLCMAHRHHMFFEEQSECIVISNGCLVGVDSHSKKLRLTSKPSQTLIVVTNNNVVDSIKRILL